MLNQITLIGRFTADPELKQTNSGAEFTNFTLAVDRDFKQGDEKVADFINCTAWRHTAQFVTKYFGRGRLAVVSGRLQSRKYQDKDGNNRTAFEVVAENVYFADSKRDGGNGNQEQGSFAPLGDSDASLPF